MDLAKKESGDLRLPLENGLITEEQIFRLGQLINKKVSIDETGTTFFKSVGMALFDLVTAEMIYKKALEKGIGIEAEF